MTWWFLILALSAGVALWAAVSIYLRVRRHLRPDTEPREAVNEHNHEREAGDR